MRHGAQALCQCVFYRAVGGFSVHHQYVIKQAGIDAWKKRIGEEKANGITYQAGTLGTNIHALCEAYILGKELPKSMPNERQRFGAIRDIIDSRMQDVYAVEAAMWSDRLKVAGRTDVIGKFDNVNSVIDFKNTKKRKKPEWLTGYWLQEALYNYMFAERTMNRAIIPSQLVLIFSVENENEAVVEKAESKVWIPKALEYVSNYYSTLSTLKV